MENQNVVIVKKKHTALKIITALLAIAAICLVAYKLYQKYFKKKTEELDELDELELLDTECEEEAFEAPAEVVIVNAEEME